MKTPHGQMAFKFYQYLLLMLLFISIERSKSAGNDSGEQGSSSSGDSFPSFPYEINK